MACGNRTLDATSISYSRGISELHEQCLTISNVNNLNEAYITLYIAENEVMCLLHLFHIPVILRQMWN